MADMQYNQAYLDYMRRMGLTPSPQSYGDWMLRNNLGNPFPGLGGGGGGGGGNPPPANPPPTNPPSVIPPSQPPVVQPPSGGGGGGGGGGGQPPLTGGGGGGGSTTTNVSSSLGGGGMTPYIKSVTTNGGNNNSALLQSLIQSLSKSSSEANAAGLAQYQNLLNSLKVGSKQTMGYYKQAGKQIDNYGASEKADIEQTRLNDRAGVNQDLINRGLGNTTVLNTELGGADSRAAKSNIALGGTIAGMKSGLLERTGGMQFDLTKLKGDSILSRQNVGPDMGMYMQLLQALGASSSPSKSTPMMMH